MSAKEIKGLEAIMKIHYKTIASVLAGLIDWAIVAWLFLYVLEIEGTPMSLIAGVVSGLVGYWTYSLCMKYLKGVEES